MKRITESRNSYSCSWALRSDWFDLILTQKVMIQPLVLTLMVKINLSYHDNKKLKILLWSSPLPYPPPFVPVSINYFTFKEDLSELQPFLGNWYLLSRNATTFLSVLFLKISWGTMPPDPLGSSHFEGSKGALRRQKYVTSGASTNMSATLQNYWNPWMILL